MKKTLNFILIVILLNSCSGLQYFDLYIEPLKTDDLSKVNKILLVKDIETDQVFWNQRIVYKKSPYQVQYYNFIHWAKSPNELIKDAIIQYYKNSSFFDGVINRSSSIKPHIVLQTRIDSLEMVYKNKIWFAHLSLDFEILDREEEKVLLTYSFDRKMKMKSKKPKHLPKMISIILREELDLLAGKIKTIK